MKQKETTQLKIPSDPYECWCMPCRECQYYDPARETCAHPEAFGVEDYYFYPNQGEP